jgi:hypothetical protein
MKVAIMQPYFFPYIGYYQLMNEVDTFVVYDNIKYTKKGWINRNRIVVNNKPDYFSISLKKDSDFLNVNQRQLSEDSNKDLSYHLKKITASYSKCPFYDDVMPLISEVFLHKETNLFGFIYNAIEQTRSYLDIKCELRISSTLKVDHSLKSAERVKAICNSLKASEYINPQGGTELYDHQDFKNSGLVLKFIQTNNITYRQTVPEFVPHLSIIDVLMNIGKEETKKLISTDYTIS